MPSAEHEAARGTNLNAMALNLMGLLLLLAGGLMLGLLAVVDNLPIVLRDGRTTYALPGTDGRHVIEGTVTLILAWLGGLLSAGGIIGLVVGRMIPSGVRQSITVRRPVDGPAGAPSGRRRRRSVLILVLGATALAVAVLLRRHGL